MTQPVQSGGSQLLAGKHALVTGGSRGIGAVIASALLSHGAHVTLLGRTAAPTDNSQPIDQNRSTVSADVTDPAAVTKAFQQVRSRFGPVDILVNNAGQASSAPFLKTDATLWRRMNAVNLDGTFHCTQAALPDMLAAGWGRVVNIASTAGLTGYGYITAYCASKHGVIGLTRALAIEVAAKGITVNAVCPGYTDTDMVKETIANIVAKTGRTPDQALAELTARNPQRRLIKPEEVANTVAWLCLPGTESITGQSIAISGGEVM
ncbi:MAG TPA: SDR family NAD(P)-dependent oxidoreductase [Candidatus Acidoferrum sp.]|jgi:NAD(P)-dependent dehydrogenase (short-subunit alcohol dehydrogenase family)